MEVIEFLLVKMRQFPAREQFPRPIVGASNKSLSVNLLNRKRFERSYGRFSIKALHRHGVGRRGVRRSNSKIGLGAGLRIRCVERANFDV